MSTIIVSTFSNVSSASAFLMRIPFDAPLPVPTMIDIGVARPRAHGQAMIRTATAFTRANAMAGSGPKMDQTINVTIAMTITAGTNQEETRSTSRWIGARERCAAATICTICDSRVSSPTCVACMTNEPVPFTVPPVTRSSLVFSTGTGSPVTIDSSTEERPSSTVPSTGIFSPGRTRSRSPAPTSARSTSSSLPSPAIRRAVGGESSSSARIAPDVALRARSSRTWPRRTSVTITAAAS